MYTVMEFDAKHLMDAKTWKFETLEKAEKKLRQCWEDRVGYWEQNLDFDIPCSIFFKVTQAGVKVEGIEEMVWKII